MNPVVKGGLIVFGAVAAIGLAFGILMVAMLWFVELCIWAAPS